MDVVLLILAGIGAGLMGYLVGLASLISYPALVALGVPPVLANTSNTVGLLGSGLGSLTSGWKKILEVKVYPLWMQVVVALLGGFIGGWLLIVADPSVFEAIVPWLILVGTILVAFGPMINRMTSKHALPVAAFLLLLFVITIYGGYFGAGSGVLFFALCTLATPMTAHEALLMKSPLMMVANASAAILFIVNGQVHWHVAIFLGIGAFIGGYLGPIAQQFISETLLRWLVVAGGLTMVVWLM